jgi:uncharacterized membrane protein YbhN (UPF0104 family)
LAASNLMKLLFRALVTVLIFTLILRSIDLKLAWETLRSADVGLLLLALLLQFASTTLAAFRWHIILRNLDLGHPFPFCWRSYFKGMFFNQGLPTSIGGDALRVIDIARQGARAQDAFYGVMLDRLVGLTSLLLVNIAAHALAPDLLPAQVYLAINLIVLGGLAGFVGTLLLRHLPWFRAHPLMLRVTNLSRRLHRALRYDRLALLAASLLIHLLAMLCLYATGYALGLKYGLVVYLAIVPPALLLTLIPVSVAGWGVREGAMVALFSLIGADRAVVLTLSVLYGVMLIAVSSPGLLVYLRGPKTLRGQTA